MMVLQRERATVFPGVPAMYMISSITPGRQLQPDLGARVPERRRAAANRGAAVPAGKITGGRLVEGYGLTETSPLTHANPIYGERKPGAISSTVWMLRPKNGQSRQRRGHGAQLMPAASWWCAGHR